MFCPKCGKELPDEAAFCTACGLNLAFLKEDNETKTKSSESVDGEGLLISSIATVDDNGMSNGQLDSTGNRAKLSSWKLVLGIILAMCFLMAIVLGLFMIGILPEPVLMKEKSTAVAITEEYSTGSEEAQAEADTETVTQEPKINTTECSSDEEITAVVDGKVEPITDKAQDDSIYFNDAGIHQYELIVSDVSWTQAYEQCLRMGGHLVRINSDEEYQVILNQIHSEGKDKVKFWLGGHRDENDDYRWIYNDNYNERENIIWGDVALNRDPIYQDYWFSGEPSLYDDATKSDEDCMNMFYVKKLDRWGWNDVPDDVLAVADFYSGSMGYICEYE